MPMHAPAQRPGGEVRVVVVPITRERAGGRDEENEHKRGNHPGLQRRLKMIEAASLRLVLCLEMD
jgi:hypothetical protein